MERRWAVLFEDLGAGFEAAERQEAHAELPELIRSDWAQTSLEQRLRAHAGTGQRVTVRAAGRSWTGCIERTGEDWFGFEAEEPRASAIVRSAALEEIEGLAVRHDASEPGILGRLGLGHALRGIARTGAPVRVHRMAATERHGVIVGVGRDYLELSHPPGAIGERTGGVLLPFTAIAAVESMPWS